MKLLKRLTLVAVFLAVALCAACQFLPEKYAISVPVTLFGFGGGAPAESVYAERLRAPADRGNRDLRLWEERLRRPGRGVP